MTDSRSPTVDAESGEGQDPRAGLLKRLILLLTAPGRLGDHLRERPVWWDVLLIGALLVAASNWALPPEVWEDFGRAQALGTGSGSTDGSPPAPGDMIRLFSAISAPVAWVIFMTISAGLMTFVFAFVFGDEGRFRQYFAGTAHAGVVSGIGALLVAPLRVARGDPQLTLSVGTFLQGSLEGTFVGTFLGSLDLFGIWSWIVMAVLFSRFDEHRSVGSSVAVVLSVFMGLVAVLAWVQYRALG